MDLEQRIKDNLLTLGEDYDNMKPFMQKWLEKIEAEIQDRYQAQKSAIQTLRGMDYSVKSIAAKIGASRTTMYNHEQLLKRYIEQSSGSLAAENPFTAIGQLQEEKSVQQDQITKLMERDVDIELLKMQNQNLSTTLAGKNEEIERLSGRISELSRELEMLRSSGKASSQRTTVPFRKK